MTQTSMVRTRMAPSPTGYLHIGTARTALFNYLYARKHGGQFVMRMEDTDTERSRVEFEKDIIEGLKWLGIQWDEGPDCGGPYGPYCQSERFEMYKKYLKELFEKDLLYPCYCTQEELEQERELQTLAKQPPRYSGKCSQLSINEREELEQKGKTSTLRFRMPRQVVTIKDLIRGDVTFDTATLDDIIIAKNFDTPLYNFAVVVDDYLMKITHVIRGEDHISNTPKQILLAQTLGFAPPQFGHLSLILNADKTKLSKRQNKVSLLEYRQEGYLPNAIVNFMVLLGWSPKDDRELFSLDELESSFDLAHVHKAGAVFNLSKLDWFNAHYIRHLSRDELTALCAPYLSTQGGEYDEEHIRAIVALEQERMKKLSDIVESTKYFFVDLPIYDPAILLWKDMKKEECDANLLVSLGCLSAIDENDFSAQSLETSLKEAIAVAQRKNGEILWPLRVALTGLSASPSPFDVAAIIGKERTLKRIEHARSLLQPTT